MLHRSKLNSCLVKQRVSSFSDQGQKPAEDDPWPSDLYCRCPLYDIAITETWGKYELNYVDLSVQDCKLFRKDQSGGHIGSGVLRTIRNNITQVLPPSPLSYTVVRHHNVVDCNMIPSDTVKYRPPYSNEEQDQTFINLLIALVNSS